MHLSLFQFLITNKVIFISLFSKQIYLNTIIKVQIRRTKLSKEAIDQVLGSLFKPKKFQGEGGQCFWFRMGYGNNLLCLVLNNSLLKSLDTKLLPVPCVFFPY